VAEIAVQGLAELDALLKTLPAKIEANILRGAVRAGQKVVRDKAVQEAPEDSGELKRSIRVKTDMRALRRGYVRADVVAGNPVAWYAHLVHFGTATFYQGSGRSVRKPYVISATDNAGKRFGSRELRRINRGSQASALYFQGKMVEKVVHPGARANPFMSRAAEVLNGPALDAFVAYVQKRLPKELEKAGP